jgi:hypothetical protein
MINETKKRDASPLDHLDRPGMARRIADVTTKVVPASSKGRTPPFEGVDLGSNPGAGTKSKRGRPTTTGKPWEALGISRQAYYKRQKKENTK